MALAKANVNTTAIFLRRGFILSHLIIPRAHWQLSAHQITFDK